jgi:dipeptidyl aminopeptidase/acylaminoacyl peptidase
VGYGGGDFTVAHGWATSPGRGRLRQASGDKARPILPGFGSAASPRVSPDGKWLVYVHSYERVDGLALTDAEGRLWPRKLAFGTDFVMQPAWHPAGTHLAYIAWDHPLMPWDGTELRVATLEESGGAPCVASVETIAGDSATAIFQPEFSPDGRHVAYVSDKTSWTQLYLYDLEKKSHAMLTTGEAEHGRPAWSQGMRVYGWTHDGRALYYLRNDQGVYSLWRYDVQGGASQRINALDHYTSMSQLAVSPRREAVALIASASKIPPRIISYEPEGLDVPQRLSLPDTPTISITVEEGVGERIHRRSSSENLLPDQLSEARAITWTGHDGETVYGIYYPPASDACEGAGAPPLIVEVHGGPTSQRGTAHDGEAQFLATRGFAVLQVNHRGSTAMGKPT